MKVERPHISNSGHRSSLPAQQWSRSYKRAVNYGTGNKEGNQQRKQLRCYICDNPNHLACQCKQGKTESPGKKTTQNQPSKSTGTRVIRTSSNTTVIKSGCCCVKVKIEGVAVSGLIDTGSDITIIRGDLFYQIVSESGLKLQSLKPAEQKACTYDQKPITLDGHMDMKVSFGDKTIITTVYVKLVAPDQLLLSETVCRHLGIVSYHPNVQSVKRCQPVEQNVSETNALCVATTGERESCEFTDKQVLPPVEDNLSDVKCTHKQPVNESLQPSEQPRNFVKQDSKTIVSSARVRLISTLRLPAKLCSSIASEDK